MTEKDQEKNVFDPETLAEITLEELKALKWIKGETKKVRDLVEKSIERFLSDRHLGLATDSESKLSATCDARHNKLNKLPLLRSFNLTEQGISKPVSEQLPYSLYPLVYLQMLQNSGIEVFDVLRISFEELLAGNKKNRKTNFLTTFESNIPQNSWLEANKETINETLNNLLSSVDGRARLGKILFKEGSSDLADWEVAFPDKPLKGVPAAPGEDLELQKELKDEFLKVSYFAGNPHISPGLFTAFKNMMIGYIGKHRADSISVVNTKKSFTVRLAVTSGADRNKMKLFLDSIEILWAEKHPSEPALVIEAHLLSNGDSGRGQLFV